MITAWSRLLPIFIYIEWNNNNNSVIITTLHYVFIYLYIVLMMEFIITLQCCVRILLFDLRTHFKSYFFTKAFNFVASQFSVFIAYNFMFLYFILHFMKAKFWSLFMSAIDFAIFKILPITLKLRV